MNHQTYTSYRLYQATAAHEERERELRRQILERKALDAPAPASTPRRGGAWRRLLIRTHLVHRTV
ncbi:MAG TPA: hypothetical protein VEX12_13555 [Microbacterium sp.]|nr:hypothetical protein [Microbacterium sp.]